jgi:hypothetical protein
MFSDRLKAPQSLSWNQCVAAGSGAGFLDRHESARIAVVLPTPNSVAIADQGKPCARSRAILVTSAETRGLPKRLPFARAFLRPARTRSQMRLRSSTATAPKTVKTILPVGVEVSTCSERLMNSSPRALNVSRALNR